MTSNYILYVADLKADDWVRVRITAPSTRKGTAETFILDNKHVEAWLTNQASTPKGVNQNMTNRNNDLSQ